MRGEALRVVAAAATGPGGLQPSSYLWSLLQMLGALLLVCALAYLLLRGLRRLLAQRSGGGALRVLERCPLDARHSLWIVEVSHRYFLLGSSDVAGGTLTRLAELDGAALPAPAAPPSRRSFREILAGLPGARP